VVDHVDPARGSALNERELWREMVRWSGGRIVEEGGVLLVSGPSPYLRVAIRSDPRVDGAAVVARATEFFGAEPTGFLVLVRRPDDEDIEREVRLVADEAGVVDYGRVVAEANDDPGERERAPLLFHDETIIAPHIAAFVAYMEAEPVACAMTLVSHRVAGVFYVATVEHARRRGLGDSLTRLAARTGFEMGADAAWLGASEMGAGLYRRIGFEDLGATLVELESPDVT
jgi:ribosomal protein S18 acetylase RimI-like enzyme